LEDKLFCNQTNPVACKAGQALPNTFGKKFLILENKKEINDFI